MIIIRSILFYIVFSIGTFIQAVVFAIPYFILPRIFAWYILKNWIRWIQFLMRVILKIKTEISGLEYLSPNQSFIIAPKHQSAWDSFSFVPYIKDPIVILKRSLQWMPILGQYILKTNPIFIDRSASIKAIKDVTRKAKDALKEKRQIIIFPEGTRRAPGDEPQYKSGIAAIYLQLNIPVVAIAHNAGLHWPKKGLLKYPGLIKCRVLPPIQPGLSKKKFMKTLIDVTETACTELLIEEAKSKSPPPIPPKALEKLKTLGIY